MKKTLVLLYLLIISSIISTSTMGQDSKKTERVDTVGYAELNGDIISGSFFAQVEIEYIPLEYPWAIYKSITAVYITAYKFCSPEVKYRVPWKSTGGRLRMYEVDSSDRFHKDTPCFGSSIEGIPVWIEFPGFMASTN